MAVITTTFDPDPILFPFEGLEDLGPMERTAVPRAAVRFVVAAGAVTLAGVGDDQRLVVNLILPVNFAYVPTDFNIRLSSADIADWNNVGEISYADSGSGDRTFLASQEVVSNGLIDVSTISKIWCPCGPLLSSLMLQVPGGGAPRGGVKLSNPVTNGAAALLDLYVRFLQYDVRQTHHQAVNTPVLVR